MTIHWNYLERMISATKVILLPCNQVEYREYQMLHGILSDDEQAICGALTFERDRKCYTLSHAMLRLSLAQVTARSPRSLEFSTLRYGKPKLNEHDNIHFNITHIPDAAGIVICDGPCGIDLCPPAVDIPWHSLTIDEIEHLQPLDSSIRAWHFAAVWALKEAYLKATGRGFATAPETVGACAHNAELTVSQWGVPQEEFRLLLTRLSYGYMSLALPLDSTLEVTHIDGRQFLTDALQHLI